MSTRPTPNESIRPEIAAFLARVRAHRPDLDVGTPTVRRYGDSASMSKRIIDVILNGAKTGGFSPLLRYERTGAALPRVGEYVIVTQFDGAPVLLYRLTEVEVLPFDRVVERHTEIEAAELRPLEAWRKFHRVFWGREFAQYGVEFTDATPVVFQRFELIHPHSGADATPTTAPGPASR